MIRGENNLASINSGKTSQALDNLLSRENYLVTQENNLAKSFGNLSAFQHKVLDYCFSFVQAEDDKRQMYQGDLLSAIHHLGLHSSGDSYKRIVLALKALNLKTAVYLQTQEPDGQRGILMTHLFDHIKLIESGRFEFRFSEDVAPYIFQLKRSFYSFHLSELAIVRSKYTLIMMKLWNANGHGKWAPAHGQLPDAVIEGSLAEWESWFLGLDDSGAPKQWSPARFRQQVLTKAIDELSRLYPNVNYWIIAKKDGRKVIGYRVEIHPRKATK